jgi:hypothetical protein
VQRSPGRALDPNSREAKLAAGGLTVDPSFQNLRTGAGAVIGRAAATLNPLKEVANSVVREVVSSRQKYGRAENEPGSMAGLGVLWRGIRNSHPWTALVKGWKDGTVVSTQTLYEELRKDPKFRPVIDKVPGGAVTLGALTDLELDTVTGKTQARVAKTLAGLAGKGVQLGKLKIPGLDVQARLEKAIPKLGKVAEERRLYRGAGEAYSRHGAKQDPHLAEAADFAADVKKTSQQQMKAGAKIRVKSPRIDPATGKPHPTAGRTVNRLAELTGDWMEAGSPGAKHATTQEVLMEAARLQVDPAEVERLGARGRALTDKLGQELVQKGLLSQEAYNGLKGQYLPRLYLMTSGGPGEAEKLLLRLEKAKAITPEAAGYVREQIRTRLKGRGSGSDFTKAREIEDFSKRIDPSVARIASSEATPAVTRYTAKATRELADAGALDEISKNPAMATTRALANDEQKAHWHPIEINGQEHLVHPGVKKYIDFKNSDELIYKALKGISPVVAHRYKKVNQAMRAVWVSSPRTAVNNAVGNYELGSSAAALNGAEYNLAGYARANKEIRDWRKAGTVTNPLLKEALEETDILASGQGLIPKGAQSVKGGFGVETAAQRALALPGRAYEGYVNHAYRDVEQSGRFYLYKVLRDAGHGVQESAGKVRAAMIDYSDIGPLRRSLEQNNILPFVTFPSKAIFQYANLAVRRPDLFDTYTGERLRTFLDEFSDKLAMDQGRQPQAKKQRLSGEAKPSSFPIPGKFDQYGVQAYARVPFAAPILQAGPSSGDLNISTSLEERVKSGFPTLRVPVEEILNRSAYNGMPIVEPGLIPQPDTGHEELKLRLMHAGKAFLPQLGDIQRGYNAATGTVPYLSRRAPRAGAFDALLRSVTGIALDAGLADNEIEKLMRGGKQMQDPKHKPYKDYADELSQRFRDGKEQIDPEQRAYLQTQTDSREIKKAMKAVILRMPDIIASDYYTGEDRKAAIKRTISWIRALGERYGQLKRREAGGAAPGLSDDLGGAP